MAFWNKKKPEGKIEHYLAEKNINYEIETAEYPVIKFELCFTEAKFILYPYLSVDNDVISFNVNVSQNNSKNYDYTKLNEFNLKSMYFKAYLTSTGLVVLEYRFKCNDELSNVLDDLIESLFNMAEVISNL